MNNLNGFSISTELFNTKVPIVFDDTNRRLEFEIAINTARYAGLIWREYKTTEKAFIVLC